MIFPQEIEYEILQILKRGNSVELKKEKGKIVAVEIQRRVRAKQDVIFTPLGDDIR